MFGGWGQNVVIREFVCDVTRKFCDPVCMFEKLLGCDVWMAGVELDRAASAIEGGVGSRYFNHHGNTLKDHLSREQRQVAKYKPPCTVAFPIKAPLQRYRAEVETIAGTRELVGVRLLPWSDTVRFKPSNL